MLTLEDQLCSIPISFDESQTISKRLVADGVGGCTIGEYSAANGFKPMRVAQELIELRPNDSDLRGLVKTMEKMILKFGTTSISKETVEGDLRPFDSFWRNNDPLGVYQPGDMFYVDPNHPWARYFPIMIVVPTVLAILVPIIVSVFT